MTTATSRVLLGALAAVLLSGCWTRVVVDDDSSDAPPAAYIATSTPVYYDGVPCYWYGNRWYRRDGVRWRVYRSEPSFLYQHRTRVVVPVVRQSYGRTYYRAPPVIRGTVRIGGGVHRARPVRP